MTSPSDSTIEPPVAPEQIPATEPVTPDPAVEAAVYSDPDEVTAKIEVPAEQTVIVQDSEQPGVPPTTLYPSHVVTVTTASKMADYPGSDPT